MSKRPQSRPANSPSPVIGREGSISASIGQVCAVTPLSNSAPQGGRGEVGATPEFFSNQEGGSALILLGEFGRAHGLKGEVRLKSFTADPKTIATYNPLQGEDGRSFTLKSVRPAGGGSPDLVIARVEGVTTREAAEALNRIRLYAPRERLSGAQSENEFLLADLIGLVAKDKDGAPLGTVVAVPNYGGGDLLEIAPEGGGATALLPFTMSFVPEVHVASGYVVVDAQDLFSDEQVGGGL